MRLSGATDFIGRAFLLFFDGIMRHGSTVKIFIIRQHFTTFSDGVIRYNSTAYFSVFRRRYLLYFDGGNQHFPTAVSAIIRRLKPTLSDGVIRYISTAYFLLFQHKTRRRFVMRNAAAQISIFFRNSFPIKNKRRYVSASPHKFVKIR